ncbi:MAG: alpha/beta hydrolase [Chloroflexota bacterium]
MPELTIVAIHGNGGGAFRFDRIRPFLPDAVRFLPITLPGFAAKPADPALQTLSDYADHLHGIVAQEQRPLVLLGTGIGGSIALEYVQRNPEAIDGLILHAPVGTRLEKRLFPRFMKLPGMRRLGQLTFSSPITRPLFRRLLFHQPVPNDYLNRFFNEYRQCSVFGQMFDIITQPWFDGLRPVDIPTVLLWGERERVLTVDQLDDYKQLLPNHTTRIVPDWDHFPMIEQPAEYSEEMVQLARQLVKAESVAHTK